jgi:hypothetical protein
VQLISISRDSIKRGKEIESSALMKYSRVQQKWLCQLTIHIVCHQYFKKKKKEKKAILDIPMRHKGTLKGLVINITIY